MVLINFALIVHNDDRGVNLKTYNFTIFIEKDEAGIYVARVPALRGCHAQASSLEEIYPRIKEAIKLYLAAYGFNFSP
jgi:predicted RNase H-like HicB family nuclease